MQNNAVITFVKNKNPKKSSFDGTEKIFSMPYSMIEDAIGFCKREKLDEVYVGFSYGQWRTSVDNYSMEFYVTVNEDGIHPDTKNKYVYTINRIGALTTHDMPD